MVRIARRVPWVGLSKVSSRTVFLQLAEHGVSSCRRANGHSGKEATTCAGTPVTTFKLWGGRCRRGRGRGRAAGGWVGRGRAGGRGRGRGAWGPWMEAVSSSRGWARVVLGFEAFVSERLFDLTLQSTARTKHKIVSLHLLLASLQGLVFFSFPTGKIREATSCRP